MKISDRILSTLSYLSWLFWVVAFAINSNNRNEYIGFHLKQGLVLQIYATLAILVQSVSDALAFIMAIVVTIYFVWGVICALIGSTHDIPGLNIYKYFAKN